MFVQILVLVIAQISTQETGGPPELDMPAGNPKALGHLLESQHSLFTQPMKTALQSILDRQAGDHPATEGLAIAGDKAVRVQDAGDPLIGMLIEQPINLGNDSWWSYSDPPRKRQLNRLGGSSGKPYVDQELFPFDQGHVFDQQASQSFALPIGRMGVMP
jgi:hypothetical protein